MFKAPRQFSRLRELARVHSMLVRDRNRNIRVDADARYLGAAWAAGSGAVLDVDVIPEPHDAPAGPRSGCDPGKWFSLGMVAICAGWLALAAFADRHDRQRQAGATVKLS